MKNERGTTDVNANRDVTVAVADGFSTALRSLGFMFNHTFSVYLENVGKNDIRTRRVKIIMAKSELF